MVTHLLLLLQPLIPTQRVRTEDQKQPQTPRGTDLFCRDAKLALIPLSGTSSHLLPTNEASWAPAVAHLAINLL